MREFAKKTEGLNALAGARTTRKALRAAELPEEIARAVEAADYGHIDRELDKLTE